jgi:hypothetical protein
MDTVLAGLMLMWIPLVLFQGARSDAPLNARIVACGAKGDADGLLGLVRREATAGEGPEALSFSHVNCATWLNRYVAPYTQHMLCVYGVGMAVCFYVRGSLVSCVGLSL